MIGTLNGRREQGYQKQYEKLKQHCPPRKVGVLNHMQHTNQADKYIEDIRRLATTFDGLSGPFRKDIGTDAEMTPDWFSSDYWRRNTYGNALIRLRLFTENNFCVVETIGLLSVARYIFELSVWLRLFEKDNRYCLVYYKELLETQLRYCKDLLAQLHREVELLKRFDALDNPIGALASSDAAPTMSAADYGIMVRNAMNRVDAEASRYFSLYLDDAKTNGYGFQAYLVETKAVPPGEAAIAEIERKLLEFAQHVPEDVRNLAKPKWNWKNMSEKDGILHEHDYIYSYASKLLHATPASLTTDQKNLEMPEVCLFLRYIYVKMLEIADLAYAQPECKIRPVP